MKKINKTVGGRDYCFSDCIYEMCKYHQNQGLCNTPQNLEEAEKCDKYKKQYHWWEEDNEYLGLMIEDEKRMCFDEPIATINKNTKEYELSKYISDLCSIHDYDHYHKDDSIDELKNRIEEYIRYDLADQIEILSHILGCINRSSDVALG